MRIIGYIFQFWGLFQLVVRVIEEAGDENGWGGEEKLMHARLLTEWLANHFNITLPDRLWDSLSVVISAVVSILNLLGVFKHKEEKEAADAVVILPASAPAVAEAAVTEAKKTLEDYHAQARAEFERLTGRQPHLNIL